MAARLEFGILGPLEVRLDGNFVRVGGPRQRALLALLLCHANHVVSRDQLAEELLDGQSALSADRMLRVQVSRLRAALDDGGAESRILARPPGYSIRIAEDELDLHVFEKRVAEGRMALERGDARGAATLFRQAESLWRGRPLADLESERFTRMEAQRLEILRLAAIEERVEAELTLGRHFALCAELESLARKHPLNERVRGQLMLALYRSGRQADALNSYKAARSLLVDELGVEPGPQLKQLQVAILRQDAGLNLPEFAQIASSPIAEQPAVFVSRWPGKDVTTADRRGRARWSVAAASVGAVLLGLTLVPLSHGGPRHDWRNANLLELLTARGTQRAAVLLQARPTDVAAGAGSLWVAEADQGVVVRVNPRREVVMATIPVGTKPSRVIAAGGQIWVLDQTDRTVSRIDPGTNTVAQVIFVEGDPSDIAVSAGSLWIADRSGGTVQRIDPVTGQTQKLIGTGGDPSGLAAAGGVIWVATDEAGTVDAIDARTGAVTEAIRVGDAPTVISADRSSIWVLDPLDATVSQVDPRRAAVVATIPTGGAPTTLAQAGGYIWVADGQESSLLRIDPRRDAVMRSKFRGDPSALAAASGGIWAALAATGVSHQGGTLTSINVSYDIPATIDPAAGTSVGVTPAQLTGLANDGLVTLDHAAGSSGARLVPDLALALPVPADDGRTYTFHMRPGIHYSTGGLLMPSDVAHSFERLFKIGSSGTSWYLAIAGSARCLAVPKGCDLSHGIVADNRARTVTFHLTRPDPDFLYKLTLSYADVLPSSAPAQEARSPLPATGPYMITRYVPGREMVLNRNPHFREWSAAAQPSGYPDRVVLQLGMTPAQGAAAIADGAADFMPSLGALPASKAAYFLHHRGQLRINPVMITGFMFLNVNAAPFDQLRVRRAVNLALDRRQIADAYGGPLVAQPTCQILPPHMPGYRAYCPYTLTPSADGGWHGPDLALARRLVAESGTAGMKVTVWNTPTPQVAVDETRAAVTVLRRLGYRASLRLLPPSTYFSYTNDSRNGAQVIDGGWGADYASADDFIGKLTCGYFTPRNGQVTSDASEFCDAGFDHSVARAALMQTTDPAAAAAQWAALDRRLTDLAIWLPTVTPNEIDLISRRVGNYQYNTVWGPLLDQMWVRRA